MSTTPTTPQILVRGLDATGDVLWGQGQANFLSNVEAVAQLILTRLRLFEGEWWADKVDGLPLWQSILGVYGAQSNLQAISLLFQQRILSTPFVSGLSDVQASYDPSTRLLTFAATVQTAFGSVVVNYQPQPPAQGLP